MSYMYGLDHSNKDFEKADSFGKNTFTTAFPIALANYIDEEKRLPMNYIVVEIDGDGRPKTLQKLESLAKLIGIDPRSAYYAFEDSFSGYDAYAVDRANRSDIVIKDYNTGKEVSAFEVKLVVVPTSGTASKSREEQLCELVVRPPSIEQLCFSVAASFGRAERITISDIIVEALGNPIDYEWDNEAYMLAHRQQILDAADELTRQGIDRQAPFVLMGEWRTVGQEAEFDPAGFDVFFWSNLAFLQLFSNVMRNAIVRHTGYIGRPERALIWFVKSMFDYAAQGSVMFNRTHSLITFGGQTDKAGSFTNDNIAKFVLSDNFIYPRVPAEDHGRIISAKGVRFLRPERRLDAVLYYTTTLK